MQSFNACGAWWLLYKTLFLLSALLLPWSSLHGLLKPHLINLIVLSMQQFAVSDTEYAKKSFLTKLWKICFCTTNLQNGDSCWHGHFESYLKWLDWSSIYFLVAFSKKLNAKLKMPSTSPDLEFSASTVWDCKNVKKIARSEDHQNAAKIVVFIPSKDKLCFFCI